MAASFAIPDAVSGELSEMLNDSAANFLRARFDIAELSGSIHATHVHDSSRWKEMADLGWLGMTLPETLGGLDMQLMHAAGLARLFGAVAFPDPFVAASIMPAALLSRCTASGAVEAIIDGLTSGDRLVTLAWSEGNGQMDPLHCEARIIDGQLHGTKRFVPAVASGGLLLVTALDGDGIVVVSVDCDAAGVSIVQQSAAVGALAAISFEGVSVGDPIIRGNAANEAVVAAVEAGRIGISAYSVGLAVGCHTITLDYVKERIQFGRAIGSFQTVQHRLVDIHIQAAVAEASWRNAAALYDLAPVAPATLSAISSAKARAGQIALAAAKLGVQLHGAMGFTEEGSVGHFLRSAMFAAGWLGSSSDHRRRFLALRPAMETEDA